VCVRSTAGAAIRELSEKSRALKALKEELETAVVTVGATRDTQLSAALQSVRLVILKVLVVGELSGALDRERISAEIEEIRAAIDRAKEQRERDLKKNAEKNAATAGPASRRAPRARKKSPRGQ